jgi:uroporphyrin-III C-methyltransferase / precorrin-2 dehydrogenase / sirohydrochlorin ferrochelatase
MRWLPLFLDLRGRTVAVVGGGAVAERKIDLLLQSGARIRVISPSLTAGLERRAAAGEIAHQAHEFLPGDLDGARLVVAATDAPLVNRAVAVAAQQREILVNVVDDAELSTGILPAIVDRSPLVIAIGTEGSAPALARHVRAHIESLVDESFGRLAQLLGRWRGRIRRRVPGMEDRRRLYEQILRGPVADSVRQAREEQAGEMIGNLLAEARPERTGLVQIVGAGPGDPGLLTLNALRALQSADVILYDRLVSPGVLALARREAERIDVGKMPEGHSASQARIHALMLEHAALRRRVVRLKGGDPFIFGRGGEEIEFLRAHGIAYEVLPGITAAVACAAYAGIPLTHRKHSGSVRFLTAHCQDAIDGIDWHTLADQRETLAIYMAVKTLGRVQAQLLHHGRSPSTPVAFVENGSRPDQRVIIGTLGEAVSLAALHEIASPALLLVGEVAALGAQLHWYGTLPLVGAAERAAAERSAANQRLSTTTWPAFITQRTLRTASISPSGSPSMATRSAIAPGETVPRSFSLPSSSAPSAVAE